MTGRAPPWKSGGFSLIEVIAAMGLLVIGMSGILALFSAALALQKEATERIDIGLSWLAVQAEVERDLAAHIELKGRARLKELDGVDLPVPGDSRYRYRVTLQPMTDDPLGRGYWARIEILARTQGRERVHDLGYIPIIPEKDNDALIRGALAPK